MNKRAGFVFSFATAVAAALASCGGSAALLQSGAGTGAGTDAASDNAAPGDSNARPGCIVATPENYYDYSFTSAACLSDTCPSGTTRLPNSYVDHAYGCGTGPEKFICVLPYCPSSDASAAADAADGLAPSTCASAATTEACVTCCRQPAAPNYGGFELYAYDTCVKCGSCSGLSPCGTNGTPPAGQTCVSCLQRTLAASGVPSNCKTDPGCTAFAACLQSCPVR